MRVDGTTLHAGDLIAIDGTTGAITTDDVPLVEPEVGEAFDTVLRWADELRTLGVRTNADTPEDARKAREFGAEGIGLCRTEHMFFGEDRHEKMVAGDPRRPTTTSAASALDELLPLQQGDFEGIFEAMEGLPVTIRLLDPPLHEFLPRRPRRAERARGADAAATRRVRSLQEVNPMLGTRGVRLGILYPEIYEMQVEAIFARGQGGARAHGRDAPRSR